MKRLELLFAVLRKSKAVLKDYAIKDIDRQRVIKIKYEYSKLDSTLRNLMRIMAMEIDRFEIVDYSSDELALVLVGNSIRYPQLVDTKTGTTFTINQNCTVIKDVTAFTDFDHKAFVVAFASLVLAKERQSETMAKHAIAEQRLNALSEYR
jgi:hypothetical protein